MAASKAAFCVIHILSSRGQLRTLGGVDGSASLREPLWRCSLEKAGWSAGTPSPLFNPATACLTPGLR